MINRRQIGDVEEDGWNEGRPRQARAQQSLLTEPAVLDAVREVLLRSLPELYLDPFSPAPARYAAIATVLRQAIAQQAQQGGVLARLPNDLESFKALYASTIGWGVAQKYLDDPKVNEIKLNGVSILVQEQGRDFEEAPETFTTPEEVRRRALFLASKFNVKLDAATPEASIPVKGGSRVHVCLPPLVMNDGVLVCIRRGRTEAWDLADLIQRRSLTQDIADLLLLLARAECCFLIVGSVGSGKTALLEALANSWPGRPHIVSAEDNVQEINIRRQQLWTRKLVNTSSSESKLAFAKVARSALRETPGLYLLGEVRGSEAGNLTDLALTGRPVITTVHGTACATGFMRFAGYAAGEGASYSGRLGDAIYDASQGFQVIVRMDSWPSLGLRLVSEVMLVDGVEELANGRTRLNLIPLIERPQIEGETVTWTQHATATADGRLVWADGRDRTPALVAAKLGKAQAATTTRSGATLQVVEQGIAEVERLIGSGEVERALAVLSHTWAQQRDHRLVSKAQQVLAHGGPRFQGLVEEGQALSDELARLMAVRDWATAKATYDTLLANLGWMAATAPAEGWQPSSAAIQAGLAAEATTEAAIREAEGLSGAGDAHGVMERLRALDITTLDAATTLRVLRLRATAQEQLLRQGQGSTQTLASLRAQIAVLEAQAEQRTMNQEPMTESEDAQ